MQYDEEAGKTAEASSSDEDDGDSIAAKDGYDDDDDGAAGDTSQLMWRMEQPADDAEEVSKENESDEELQDQTRRGQTNMSQAEVWGRATRDTRESTRAPAQPADEHVENYTLSSVNSTLSVVHTPPRSFYGREMDQNSLHSPPGPFMNFLTHPGAGTPHSLLPSASPAQDFPLHTPHPRHQSNASFPLHPGHYHAAPHRPSLPTYPYNHHLRHSPEAQAPHLTHDTSLWLAACNAAKQFNDHFLRTVPTSYASASPSAALNSASHPSIQSAMLAVRNLRFRADVLTARSQSQASYPSLDYSLFVAPSLR